MRPSTNECWHVIPYGHSGEKALKPGPLANYPGLWQRPAKCLHFVELVHEGMSMTLEEWAEKNNAGVRDFNKPGYDPMKTVSDRSYPDRPGIFHLTDYVVTSVSAGTIWLAKRR